MSGLTPFSKVTVIVTCPREVEDELKYSIPSIPVSDCSMTWVTLFWIASAEAPG